MTIKDVVNKGLVYDMPSSEYHSLDGTYSSSQLKDLLVDPSVFHAKYIEKSIEREESSAFDVGSYFHTAILEPEKLKDECVIFKGTRRGAEWEKFKLEHQGKSILTESDLEKAEILIKAVKRSPVAMGRLERCKAEVSCFAEITICGCDIYHDDKLLGRYGWEWSKSVKAPKSGVKVVIKTRADAICDGFILDLKSTSSNVMDLREVKQSISNYSYDLSAALYLDMFSAVKGVEIREFLWTFASKNYGNSKTYVATDKNIQVGRAKYRKALLALAEGIENNWKFEDSIGHLEPNYWELEILENKKDLL